MNSCYGNFIRVIITYLYMGLPVKSHVASVASVSVGFSARSRRFSLTETLATQAKSHVTESLVLPTGRAHEPQ